VEALIGQLEEDLLALAKLLRGPGPLPTSYVRIIASATLRKWLLDGNLSRAANALGVSFTLPTLDTSAVVEAVGINPAITFFLAGGVRMDGVPIRGYYVAETPFTGRPELPIDSMAITRLSPSRYLRSPRVFHQGQWFDAEQIIRFVANKKGGVHFDPTREHAWQEKLDLAANFFVAGNPDNLTEIQLIEPYSAEHRILLVLPKETGNLWTCLDIELLAAAQTFLNIHCDDEPLLDWKSF